MTIGEKIKYIRIHRGMTQRELGVAIGFEGKSADNRIAQYETNYRVPKKDMLYEIANALRVNPLNFVSEVPGSAEDIMQTFFWLDEDNHDAINLFQLVKNSGKNNDSDNGIVSYHDGDNWPAQPPVGLWFNYGVVDDFMREWLVRKNELRDGVISRDEYLEWKLNWPESCDGCGKYELSKGWSIR